MMNEQYDKTNGDISFIESTHQYINTKYKDREYTSVTTLIGKYYEEFDSEFWSSYKACEAILGIEFESLGLKSELLNKKKFDIAYLDTFDIDYSIFDKTKQDILSSYKIANEVGCKRGSEYHNDKESKFYEKSIHRINEYNFNLDLLQGDFPAERYNFDLTRDKAILPEYLMYYSTQDGILNIAGQADIVIKDGNDIYILDYKTNAKGIKTKAFFDTKKKKKQTMYYPINNMDDHMLNHYTLQLSLYAWILQKINPEFDIKLLRLLHIDGNNKETIYDLDYKKEEVERMLKHYKKTLKVAHYRKTGEMI
jgi:hypothetical protein